jgi:hypothetical protein
MTHKVKPIVAPNLIAATGEYSRVREEQLMNELRLYFNRLNNNINTVSDVGGGSALSFPHIAAYSDVDQYATATDTPTKVLWTGVSDVVGFTLNADNTATAQYDGTYKIEYRLQAVNSDNTTSHNVVVWMQIDGVNLANSTTVFTLPTAPSGVTPTYKSLNAFITWEAVAGQSVVLYWATNQAAVSGGSNGVYLEYEGAQTSPYAHPAVPSAYGVIQYIGRE